MYELPLLTSSEFVTYLLNGISQGMIIFLVASGLTLIFGLIGLINFAHGALVALGGYGTLLIADATGSFWAGLAGAVVLVALLGLVLERSVLHRVYERPLLGFLGTFGMYVVIEELLSFRFGDQARQIAAPFPGSVSVMGASYPKHRLLIILVGAVVAIGIGALLSYTRLGMEIHATATEPETAEILGVDSAHVYTLTFVIGASLAALAGGLTGPVTSVSPGMGMSYMILAFLVIIVGGMGSFKGSLLVSLIVGQITAFGWLFLQPTYVRLGVFVAAMVFILYKPRGFFGKPEVFE
ncbi:branched-chain amino acid ABC transporter permease [Halarchaeum nitratireducens]|uniref:Branched-chain amino acid ABC transporter permease n=1 Tax=Halarchaeum nitratireducens TaxID=489913 RepID=A0A830G9Q7_9EURY|nr:MULTISPECIES: branched-chain amino acid ABC transporter permease [Halarchaeum]MBP2249777.1 branched-subunit amino acid ABC-type transport system permease component [Halarchaeum solikamskense]GGN10645.1 branched-chain amino acid ABC transporter permease [Halarchaeum nitratireducens]